ncbi:MAG: phosphoenolpyruvate--protein phosphotransferase [Deltaproteobacteria bacterium CG07_land_8_20_14_0_80_38_7]|nr:MAG: phosphoenolpyruvate--protein phosphotransferase [Deltaproteobacteria bacterium CG07_land_8_20_14_0_80_38_7]
MKTRRFKSSATTPGIAIGRAYFLKLHRKPFIKAWIRDKDIEIETKRFKKAVTASKDQVSNIQNKLCRYEGHEQINILESQRMFLQDDMLINSTTQYIRELKINAEWALDKTIGQIKLSFYNMNENYFKDRKQDIDYAGRRVMDNLMGHAELSFQNMPHENTILIAHDLSPAEVAAIPHEYVKGFVMEAGGVTSHSAIIARSFEIPAMFGAQSITKYVDEGELVILDGIKGVLIASPSTRELNQYLEIQKKYAALEKILLQDIDLHTVTKDGFHIRLDANIELIEEIPSIIQHGAEGIGLYRTEYLFLNRLDEPSEEEQYQNYVEILKTLKPKLVTVRTIDLGGDKLPTGKDYESQTNPALGLRAIRLCLRELPIFKTQLRALYRAGVFGNLRILLPMISSIEEIHEVKKIIKSVKHDLAQKSIPFKEDVPLGIMIEVPAASIIADLLAKEVDFFSIGTNDLAQYGLAIDRGNELVSDMYDPYHPAVLRMVHQAVQAAKEAHISVALCGEMAGDPLILPLLVGMEFDSLSMNAISIPRVKRTLRSITREKAKLLLAEILKMSTGKEIQKYLKKEIGHLLPLPK